ncbi:MauE/DoxX family redox-associated membrane protein [Parahaliea mediterranea]|uniref:Methylamine utilization protein MauE n=1 Tax=Parahaliea mediterranea TaxID=651086 RepID=A0A939IMS8_9GAMM|nr:MauE/DoxX family redox-associated membrane protein [Parahaliea mediterranea]MBN7797343.1 hypothetical protein [Parahaliea mediterranea]
MLDMLAYGITLFTAWLLGVSSWHKFKNLGFYRSLVAAYLGGLQVPVPMIAALAAAEALLTALMLLPASRALALAGAAGLLLAYALLMGSKLLQGRRDMRCGCAGPAADVLLSPALVVRNLVCIALCLVAIPLTPGPFGVIATLTAATVVGGFLALLYLCSEQLISNAQRMTKGV